MIDIIQEWHLTVNEDLSRKGNASKGLGTKNQN